MKWFRILGFLLTLTICERAHAQTVTVTWTTTYQTMDGWGAEDRSSAEILTSTQADLFFSATAGIGLEFIRSGNSSCPRTGACTVTIGNVTDLTSLKAAVARGALVTYHIQPPANLQYSGDFWAGTPDPVTGNCIDSGNWAAFANYTVQWVHMLNAEGVPINDIEVANEPDLNQTDSLGGCVWSAGGLDGYIKGALGPAIANATWTSPQNDPPKLALPQASNWFNTDLASTCLNDSDCTQYVSYAIGHGYGSGSQDGMGTGYCCLTATAPPSSTNGKHIWMSEVNGGSTYVSSAALWAWDPSIADGLVWARSIHDYLTISNVSLWNYWELADCCPTETGAPFNDGLTLADLSTTSKRFYVVGNWSKFVRAGWVRIGATANPVTGVFVTAFNQSSSGGFAIIAINNNSSKTSVTFSLSGFPTSPSSVTPWITSSTLSLAQQSNVSVSDGSFIYTLPAYSVTSFIGNTTTANVLAPPMLLKAAVQ